MDRRVSGGLILALALVAALVVPKVLNPLRVDGTAAIAPPPPPPVVGDCIQQNLSSFGVTSAGYLMTIEPVTVVSCSRPHWYEIVLVEAALAASTDPQNPSAAIDAFVDRCTESAPTIRPGTTRNPAGWQQQINLRITTVGPNQRQADAGQRWAACVVGVDKELVHPVRQLNGADIPPELGECVIGSAGVDDDTLGVPCTFSHDSEVFGSRNLERGSTATADDLQDSCRQFVAGLMYRPDPDADGSLVVRTQVVVWYDSERPTTTSLPMPADAMGAWVTCSVHATGGRELKASLRQLGDAPIPWAP